jgi:hypothetical protein
MAPLLDRFGRHDAIDDRGQSIANGNSPGCLNLRKRLRALRERPRSRRAAEQRDELAPPIKKTRSHGTIAKRVGLAKRPRSAKGKRSMAGTPQPREPLGFVLGLG